MLILVRYLMEREAILAFVTSGQIAGIVGRVASSWWPSRWRETGLAVTQVVTFVAVVTLGLLPNTHAFPWFVPVMATLNAVSNCVCACTLALYICALAKLVVSVKAEICGMAATTRCTPMEHSNFTHCEPRPCGCLHHG